MAPPKNTCAHKRRGIRFNLCSILPAVLLLLLLLIGNLFSSAAMVCEIRLALFCYSIHLFPLFPIHLKGNFWRDEWHELPKTAAGTKTRTMGRLEIFHRMKWFLAPPFPAIPPPSASVYTFLPPDRSQSEASIIDYRLVSVLQTLTLYLFLCHFCYSEANTGRDFLFCVSEFYPFCFMLPLLSVAP